MRDIMSVHFLEPLGGKTGGGGTPNFDAVQALFFAGGAFKSVVDPVTHNMWLVPTQALLNICPLRPSLGKFACLTRIDSTFAGNTLTRSPTNVVELRVNDSTSVTEFKNLFANIIYQGPGNDLSNGVGSNFYNELVAKLQLNNRYRKAYVVNPVMDWSTQSIQLAQAGANSYTVATKIIAVGLITIQSASGQQLARRLLSTGFSDQAVLPQALLLNGASSPSFDTTPPAASLLDVVLGTEPDITTAATRRARDDGDNLNDSLSEDDDEVPAYTDPLLLANDAEFVDGAAPKGSRRLLQAASTTTTLAPSKSSAGNSLVMSLNGPGYDAVSQLCPAIGAALSDCRMVEYTAKVDPRHAADACAAYSQGSLGTILSDGFSANLGPSALYQSNVTATLLADLVVSGCPSTTAGGRRLLQFAPTGVDVVIIITKLLLRVENGQSVVDTSRLSNVQLFQNASILQQLLGGGAVIIGRPTPPPQILLSNGTYVPAPPGYTYFGGVNLSIPNLLLNQSDPHALANELGSVVAQLPSDANVQTQFSLDPAYTTDSPEYRKFMQDVLNGRQSLNGPPTSGGVREAAATMAVNVLLLVCLLFGLSASRG